MSDTGKENVTYAPRQTTPVWVPIVIIMGVLLLGLIVAFFCTSSG